MLHRREHFAERIGKLYHGRNLPVEVPAEDKYAKGIHLGLTPGEDSHTNVLVIEIEYGTVEPEVLCCVHKLQETWDRKCELVEEVDIKPLEARGGDPTNECLQVSDNTTELEMAKVRESDDWRTRELSFYIAVGNREFKQN
jgi:hypothetical protein